MHLLRIDKDNPMGQADPYILKSGDKYYIYVTGGDGVYAYESDQLFEGWKFYGKVFSMPDNPNALPEFQKYRDYWAPSVIELDGMFYMYCSFELFEATPDRYGHKQTMHVAKSDNPLGPFVQGKQILPPFSIDSHIVKNESGLFLIYSTNRFDGPRPGTYIVVDRMLDPETPEGKPVPLVVPTLDEDIFLRDRYNPGEHWHTIEGGFYFREGDWHYLMYSGNCYERPTYYVGYARAKTTETDLTKIKFEKFPDDHTYAPVLAANEFEEGTGHHSMIKENGQWYAVYHARDYVEGEDGRTYDARSARICRINVEDGVLTAHRYPDHI